MNVITTYVQGDLSDEIYTVQPEMFIDNSQKDKVCKLNKPLYGLKQASRQWYQKLNSYLTNINFKKTAANPCVYVDTNINSNAVIIVYIDDLLIGSKSLEK